MLWRAKPDESCRPVVPIIEVLERRMLYHGGAVESTAEAAASATPSPANPGPWTVEASAPVQLFEAQGASVDGKLYVFGGFDNSKIQVTDSAEVYDPAANTWQKLPDTPAPQSHVGTATDGRVIYFAGGFRGNWYGQASSDFWEYDTVTGTWTRGPSLPAGRGAGGLVLLGRQLHFFGGAYGPDPDHVSDAGDHWVLDLDNPSAGWVAKAPLSDPRNHLGYAALNGKIYAIGGQHQLNESQGLDATVSVYDPATDSWSSAAPLPAPRSHVHNSTFVYDGEIICAGGTDTGDVASNQMLAYDPGANAWSVIGTLPDARSAAVAQAVGNEIVVATGTPTGVLPQTNTWARPLDFLPPSTAATPPAPTLGPGVPGSVGGLTVHVATPTPASVVSPAAGTTSVKGPKGATDVKIDNAGKTRFVGPVTLALYLTPDPTADPAGNPAATQVATAVRRLALAGGHSKSLPLVFRCPAGLAAGSYYVVARLTTPKSGGAAAVTASPAAVTVSAGVADVKASFAAPLPNWVRPGEKVTASLVLKNDGNALADGPMQIALSIVGDAPSQSTPLMTLTRRTAIPPGRSKRVTVRLVVPKGLGGGAYSLDATLTPVAAAGKVSAANAGGAVEVATMPLIVN